MKKQFVCVVLIGLLLISINQIQYKKNEGRSRLEAAGEYVIHKTPQIPQHQEITTMLVEDGKIFLYWDLHGIVNVYSVDGMFLYGIQVNSSTSGRGDIAYTDQKLYIFSRENHIYVFEDQKLIEHIEFAQEKKKYRRLEELLLTKHDSYIYEDETYYLLKTVSMVTKVAADGKHVVVIDLKE